MTRLFSILSIMVVMLCALASPSPGKQPAKEVLDSLNTAMETVIFSTQDPTNSDIEQWQNSYQFAVRGNRFIITYRLEVTYLKGEEIKDHYIETGTYSAALDLLSHTGISPFFKINNVVISCNNEAKCFTQDYSGEYHKKGKITNSARTKSLHKIGLILPEGLIEPTIDLLQELLQP